ncbi:MAG: hypothetical protein LBT64_01560, partial [Puniceicoccales bacterium]|nr:hypothetical protein [Puniceicoccales bacterium]
MHPCDREYSESIVDNGRKLCTLDAMEISQHNPEVKNRSNDKKVTNKNTQLQKQSDVSSVESEYINAAASNIRGSPLDSKAVIVLDGNTVKYGNEKITMSWLQRKLAFLLKFSKLPIIGSIFRKFAENNRQLALKIANSLGKEIRSAENPSENSLQNGDDARRKLAHMHQLCGWAFLIAGDKQEAIKHFSSAQLAYDAMDELPGELKMTAKECEN